MTALSWLYAPDSVAVIGASATPGKLGYLLIQAMKRGGYPGKIYPVNPHIEETLGLSAFPTLEAVPSRVGLAVIILPARQVLASYEECVRKGVRAVVIISSGFAEVAEGRVIQECLAEQARETGVRVIGPNCEGLIDFGTKLLCTFGPNFPVAATAGELSMISHSGGFTGIAFTALSEAGLGFARIVSSGNECDLVAVDFLADFGEDPRTRLIIAYLEQIREPQRFMAEVPVVTRSKPVIVLKGGRTDVGESAARSHTGALAGSPRVVEAALRQSGVVIARHMDEMAEKAIALAGRLQWMSGNRVGILSQSGGIAVEMADLCREAGLALPRLGPETERALTAMIPYYGSISNPIDFTAALMSNPQWPGECATLLAKDPAIDAVLLLLTAGSDVQMAEGVAEAAMAADKPILVAWVGGSQTAGPILNRLRASRVPVFRSTARACTGLTALAEYGRYRVGDGFNEAP